MFQTRVRDGHPGSQRPRPGETGGQLSGLLEGREPPSLEAWSGHMITAEVTGNYSQGTSTSCLHFNLADAFIQSISQEKVKQRYISVGPVSTNHH